VTLISLSLMDGMNNTVAATCEVDGKLAPALDHSPALYRRAEALTEIKNFRDEALDARRAWGDGGLPRLAYQAT